MAYFGRGMLSSTLDGGEGRSPIERSMGSVLAPGPPLVAPRGRRPRRPGGRTGQRGGDRGGREIGSPGPSWRPVAGPFGTGPRSCSGGVPVVGRRGLAVDHLGLKLRPRLARRLLQGLDPPQDVEP